MKALKAAAVLALLSTPAAALAADNEAGVPLTPTEAAGVWTVESAGRAICVVSLGTHKLSSGGYEAKVPDNCGEDLAGAAAWSPSAGGMKLVKADGETVLGFGRWSNSLFVSHRSSGVDIQLKRGGPAS